MVLGAGSSLDNVNVYPDLSKTTATALVVFNNLTFGLRFLGLQSFPAREEG